MQQPGTEASTSKLSYGLVGGDKCVLSGVLRGRAIAEDASGEVEYVRLVTFNDGVERSKVTLYRKPNELCVFGLHAPGRSA